MKALLLMGVLLGLCAQTFAQWTEASMCVSVTDACCDEDEWGPALWSSVDYTIASGERITKTFFHYDSPDNKAIRVKCYSVIGGTETELWNVNQSFCGCGSSTSTTGHPVNGPLTIRYKVWCTACPENQCSAGNGKVYFYTSVTAASCPPQCQPS